MIELKFYNKNIFESILKRQKTIETRALNPDEPHRYFGDIKKGQHLVFHFVPNGHKILVQVEARRLYPQYWDFYESEDIKKIFPYESNPNDIGLLRRYNEISPGYGNKIIENGLITIEFYIINEDYNDASN